jgi:RHS repeat-associated protein
MHVRRLGFEPLEDRRLLSIVFDGGPSHTGTSWQDTANWVGGALPGPGDDVVINAASGVTVVYSGGSDSIKSLVSANALALSGGTLTVASTVEVNNTFTINGGMLTHATILPGSGGQAVMFTPSGGTLDGVTADSNLDLATYNNANVHIVDGLTLNATAWVGNAAGSTAGQVFFDDGGTLGGTGTVVFGKSGSNFLGMYKPNYWDSATDTLTIGPGITVRGSNGTLGEGPYYYRNNSIVNQGTIAADDSGGTITINPSGVTVDVYSGFQDAGGGAPYTDLAGTFTDDSISFGISQDNFNWHPFGLAGFGADITANIIVSAPGTYTFPLTSDDGGLLFIDGNQVVNNGGLHSRATTSAPVALTAGIHTLEVQFFEDGGGGSGVDLPLPSLPVGTITIDPATFTNQGMLEATASTLTLAGPWSSTGSLGVSGGGTLNLAGTFTTADVASFSRNGGTVNLTGTLDNTGTTLALDATTGSWNLASGALKNGTLSEAGGAELVFTPSGGTLDGVTADSDLDLTATGANVHIVDGLTLNNATVWLGNASGPTYGQMFFDNTETLGGTGTVVFGKNGNNGVYADSGSTLTIGPGITIRGSSGNLSSGVPGLMEGLVNNGGNWDATTTPISSWTNLSRQPVARWGADTTTGSRNNVYPNWGDDTTWGYYGTMVNNTTGNLTYEFGKNFDDCVYLSIDGSTILNDTDWNATPTCAVTLSPGPHSIDLRFGQGGGPVGPTGLNFNQYGLAYNTSGVTDFNSATWYQFGATDPTGDTSFYVNKGNGTIINQGTVAANGSGGTITINPSGVTVNVYSGFQDAGGGAPYTDLAGTFTDDSISFGISQDNFNWHPFGLAGFGADITANIIVSAPGTYTFPLTSDDGSLLFIDGNQIVDNGWLHNRTSVSALVALTAGVHTLEVQFFEDGFGGSGVDLPLPSLPVGTITINPGTFTNQGTLSAIGGTLAIASSLATNGLGRLASTAGSTITVSGNLLGNTQDASLYTPQGTLLFNGSGTAVAPQLLEVMGRDAGVDPSGFTHNFVCGILALAGSTYVQLVDKSQNTASGAPEALYVNSLVVPAGATLDLNGLNLYTRTAQIDGTIVGGTLHQVPDSGPLALNTPTAGTIDPEGDLDEWSFFERAGRSLTVLVDPGSGAASGPVSPGLAWVQMQLLDPNGNVLDTADNTTTGSGAVVTLNGVLLPTDGTYEIQVQAPAGYTSATGNYVVTALDATPNEFPLNLDQTVTGGIASTATVDHWNFSAVAGQQVQFHLVNAAPGILFRLTGPGGCIGFDGLHGDSPLVNLPSSGSYVLTAYGSGGQTGSYAFSLTQTSQTDLILDTPYNGTLTGSGQAIVFRVDVPAGKYLRVTLVDSTSTDSNELYLKFGLPPTRASYDARYSTAGSANQDVWALRSAPGTWFVLLYGASVPAASNYTLTATTQDVAVTGVGPNQGGTTTDAVVTVTGAGFGVDTTVSLVAAGGATYPAASVEIASPTSLSVTFTSGSVPAGIYSLCVSKAGGIPYTLPDAFTMVQGGTPHLVTSIIVPNPIGFHIASTIYVQYSNTGGAAMPAPLVVLSATLNGQPGAFLTLDPSKQVAGFWTSATPDGFSHSVQFLASGSTPGLLQPGESVQVPVYYAGWLRSQWDWSHQVVFSVSALDSSNTQPIDWNSMKDSLRPASLSQAAWNAIYPNLTAQLGSTWGYYMQKLSTDAQYLAGIGERVTDISQLFGFEVEQASGYSPLASLASATDAQVAAPGLALGFARTFSPSILDRNQFGPFGWGWDDSWDTHITVDADGSVNVYEPGGSIRRFQPDSRGGYFAQAGDHGTLAARTGGGYTLTELDGQVTAYNANGSLAYVQDTDGNRITAGYTGVLLTSLTHSSGQSLTLAYNAAGLISTITDSVGRTTTYNYDPTNQYLTSVVDFDGRTTSYTYDTGSNPTTAHALLSVTHTDGSHDYFSDDAHGHLVDAHRDGGAEDTTFSYYEGRVSVTDALGDATNYFFDDRGLLIQVQNPLHDTTRFAYDSNPNLIQTVDAANHASFDWYDSTGNLKASTDALGHSANYTYSTIDDRLASVTDAKGNTTRYGYDGTGNLTSTTYADGTIESVAYDPVGDVLSITNRRGQATHFTYDAAGNVLTATFPDGSQATYTYDAHENLTSATDSTGTTTLAYDANDRLQQITYPSGRYLKYTYDAAGRRTQMVDQTGYTVNYGYDSLGNLATLKDGSGNLIAQYTYDAVGRLAREDDGNGTYTTYAYDAASELLHLVNYAPDGSVNSRFDYTYDSLGRRSTEATVDGTWTYSYDAIGELTHAVFVSTNPAIVNQDEAYFYDAAGNRTETIINGVTTVYTTNNMNEYTQVGNTHYTFDADGNMTSATDAGGTTTYTFNSQNQLTAVTGPSGSWSYQYDAFGNRVSATAGGVTTNYVIDPFGLGNLVGEYDAAGNLVAHYAYGLGLVSQTTAAGSSYYYAFDAIGSTSVLTDSTGAIVDSYACDPFGNSLAKSEAVTNPFQYVGEYGVMNEGNGLEFMRTRFFSTTAGRFASEDPLGIRGGDVNTLRYCWNDPVNRLDPTGLLTGSEMAFLFLKNLSGMPNPNQQPPDPREGALTGMKRGEQARKQVEEQAKPKTPPGLNANEYQYYQLNGNVEVDNGTDNEPLGTNVAIFVKGILPPCGPEPPPTPPANPTGAGGSSTPVQCIDPNAMLGPAGYGSQGFIADAASPLPYQVDFENDPTATAPAQEVTVTDQLDPSLDWKTLQFTAVGFGDNIVTIPANTQHYQTTVPMTYNGQTFDVDIELGVNLDTGQLYARFQSIDPNTSLPPSDVLTGFLPPEDGTGCGQGYFSYMVQPNTGLTTGTQIHNVALVSFDGAQAIATDQVDDSDPTKGTDPAKECLNTIDAAPPTSSVAALPTTETSTSFPVTWWGIDDPGGSGVAGCNVYVSDNGGPFAIWQSAVTATSATFTGQNGHTYGFYSTATDNVGNQEPTPASAEATTRVQTCVSGTTLTSDHSSGSVYGQTVVFTATVSVTPQGAPTGNVSFKDGTKLLGTGTLNAQGQATLSTSTLTIGTHTITAVYAGNANVPASSATLTQTVCLQPSNAVLTTSTSGQSVTLTVTVSTSVPGTIVPTGKVTFKAGSKSLGTSTLNGSGVATFTTTTSKLAGQTITATYGGDKNFSGSGASVAMPATTTTVIAASVSPSVFGQSVTFTATVSATGSIPTGTVKFLDGTATLGTGTLDANGHATFSTSTLAAPLVLGKHSITASYVGASGFSASSGSMTQTVSAVPTSTVLAGTFDPAVFGQTVTFTATVSAAVAGIGSPTGIVTFKDGSKSLGTGTLDANGTATFSTSSLTAPLTVGNHAITVSYAGTSKFTASSSGLTETVKKAATTSTISALPSSPVFGQSLSFTVTVSATSPGNGAPAGTVTFMDGSKKLGTGKLSVGGSNDTATFSTSKLTGGTHTITASYAGDAHFATCTISMTETVNQVGTTTALTASPASWVAVKLVTFTATVTPASGTFDNGGKVQFAVDGTNIGSPVALARGKAIFKDSNLTVGSHTITASYSGDGNFTGSSGSITQPVTKAVAKAAVTPSAKPSILGQPLRLPTTVSTLSSTAGVPIGGRDSEGAAASIATGTSSLTPAPKPAASGVDLLLADQTSMGSGQASTPASDNLNDAALLAILGELSPMKASLQLIC